MTYPSTRLHSLSPEELGAVFKMRADELLAFLGRGGDWTSSKNEVYGAAARSLEDALLEVLLELQVRHSDCREISESDYYNFHKRLDRLGDGLLSCMDQNSYRPRNLRSILLRKEQHDD